MIAGPYRVVRVPVWGRDDQFGIAGRVRYGGYRKTKPFKSEAAARKQCDRMNEDYARYEWAVCTKRSA